MFDEDNPAEVYGHRFKEAYREAVTENQGVDAEDKLSETALHGVACLAVLQTIVDDIQEGLKEDEA